MYRVLVTGSRTWTDAERVYVVLDRLLFLHDRIKVTYGGANAGTDAFTHEWAKGPCVVADRRRAQWGTHGRGAGLIRNQDMVDDGADECHAFINPCELPKCKRPKPHGTHGAADCVRRARAAGIPTTVHGFDDDAEVG